MADATRSPEHRVRCLTPVTLHGGDERLRFEIDGREKAVSLRISGFSRRLATSLPARALDLLEIAALVYGVDAAVSRGGPTDRQMGRDWHRGFRVGMPVRDLEFWNDSAVREALEAMLMTLSGDRFAFEFVDGRHKPNETRWFDFDPDGGWSPDRVLMFSGGLDSLAGTLEEIIDHGNRVALVSHVSSTKIAKVQRDLCAAIAWDQGKECLRHFPVNIQLASGTNREGTHRSRSFLFAVLGLVTAIAFGRDRVSFHENGVISLNLPPVGSVVGTRATRTTHPQVLHRFSGLFTHVCEKSTRVDNPLFWRTKTEILKSIDRLGMARLVAVTSSCADTHNRTRQHPHCGRCSQCIDRRFAVLAAGMAVDDPQEAYAVDLLTGTRERVIDRELALSYVRNAIASEVMSPVDLQTRFPAVLSAVDHLGERPEMALKRIADLLNRHGASVAGVMRGVLEVNRSETFPPDTLPRLFGEHQRAQAFGLPAIPAIATSTPKMEPVILSVDPDRRTVTIEGVVTLGRSATAELLFVLAEAHLEAYGAGLDPLDFPARSAVKLAKRLGLDSDENLRKRVIRARTEIAKKCASAGLELVNPKELIENVFGNGYRLAPDRVTVRTCNEP